MELTRLKTLTFTLLFTIASGFNAANAALITSNGYTLDTDTDIVTGGGLEWLQWDVTIGESINSALAADGTFGGNDYGTGWTLATNMQMAALFDAFSFNSTTDESAYIFTRSPFTPGNDMSNADFFISLFGTTHYAATGNYGIGVDAANVAAARFGSDDDNDDMYKLASVNSDYMYLSAGSWREIGNGASILVDQYLYTQMYSGSGVALVRTTPVPEPSTVAILALGLLGLGLRRKVRS